MKSKLAALLIVAFAAGCAPVVQAGAPGSPGDAAELMAAVYPGTIFSVQLDQAVGGASAPVPGTLVTATVIEPLLATTDGVAIPAGATVEGIIKDHHAAGDVTPEMVAVDFHRVVIGQTSYPIGAEVVHVDLAIADDEATWRTGIGSMQRPTDLVTGTVIEDAATLLRASAGREPGMGISLGFERGGMIPQGARLTLEFGAGTPTR
jgi:hypothetical protein